MNKIYSLIKNLCDKSAVGTISEAADFAKSQIPQNAEVKNLAGLSFAATFKGETDYTLMLEAHIDEIAMIVTNVTDDGFVQVNAAGGIDPRILPAARVKIWGKEPVFGTFCSTPPHLSKGEDECSDISDMYIDTLLGSRAKAVIREGDYVTFAADAVQLANDRIAAKSLDDRAACAVIITLAERIKDKKLPVNVTLLFADGEELGMRGSKTAAFALNPNEAIAIDVSFASAPDVSKEKYGQLSKGALIGVSPILNKEITNKLKNIADENSLPYQTEVMGGTTGTDSDAITLTRGGIPCGLVSIPQRNMHTPCEVVDLKDIKSICDLLEKYILSGGALNA